MHQHAHGVVLDRTFALLAACPRRRPRLHSHSHYIRLLQYTPFTFPTPGEYSRLRGTSQFPQLLRVTRQLAISRQQRIQIPSIASKFKDMSRNAENSGNIEVPALPVNTLQEGEYTTAVENSIRIIIRRYGEKTASKAEIQATMSAYMEQVARAGVYTFDAQRDLIPWYETLDAEVIRLDGAAKRGQRDDDDDDDPDEEEGRDKEEGQNKRPKRPRDRTSAGSDLSSEDERPPKDKRERKKPRNITGDESESDQDQAKFGWAPDALIREIALTPEQQVIRDAVRNHTKDLKTAMRSLKHTGVAPLFPDALWKKILLDETVDFDEINSFFFSTKLALDTVPIGAFESALHQALGRRPERKTVSSAIVWFRCFDKYSEAVETVFPSRRRELRAWREHISDLFTVKVGEFEPRIIAYDIAARKVIASNPGILFSDWSHPELAKLQKAFIEAGGIKFNDLGVENCEHPRNRRRSVKTGMKDDVRAIPALVDTFASLAADHTSPAPATQKALEKPTSSSFLSNVWRAAYLFVGGPDDDDGDEEDDKVEVEQPASYLPRYLRGFGWRVLSPRGSRTAWYTEIDEPLPHPPLREYKSTAMKTIHDNPHLFNVSTPVNVDRLASLLTVHPNQPFVKSVLRLLRIGFWPWADTNPTDDFPETWDHAWANIPSATEQQFILTQCEEEVANGHHSPAFGPDLLPGMYSTPNIAVPKPHSEDLRLVANQSAGEYCQNNMIDKSQTKGARLDSLLVFIPLILMFVKLHPGKRFLLWKSDVAGAFRVIPMHPLWQIKQIVTANILSMAEGGGKGESATWLRYVDWRACFGSRASPRAWASLMGLVVWIAVCILHMIFLCCYVDDCFSIGLVDDMLWYEPYQQSFPTNQTRLLHLWDWLGIPHKLKKQVWGEVLVIIGFLIDPNKLTATLPEDSKTDLITNIRSFASRRRRTLHEFEQLAGWMNWSLNVYPLFKPALCNLYAKMDGKSRTHVTIHLNKPLVQELLWFADHVEASSGMLFFAKLDWNPHTEAHLTIFCDASLTGMGFWVRDLHLGFTCPVDGECMRDRIFFWEALCVLAALKWYADSGLAFFATPRSPARLTIVTDNTNTVNIFDTLRALPEYNAILCAAVDIRVQHNIDLRVLHIPGERNIVADALSRDNIPTAMLHAPLLTLDTFKPPQLTLGAHKK
ncbi:hypothetical protein CPB85DRAFT_1438403 [Mucidula mucida]|nr:hypothetical protein CPB85DRAFT_1438403 [Mucidula mucida]